jgi:hypothetical protein
MTNPPDGEQTKGGLLRQILPAVLIALIAGGTAPWWYKAIFPAKPEPTPMQVSRDFLIGRWQARPESGSGDETVVDVFANGSIEFTSAIDDSVLGKARASGTWDFEKLSDRSFILKIALTEIHNDHDRAKIDDPPQHARFEVLDQNHVHSVGFKDGSRDSDFVAERVR